MEFEDADIKVVLLDIEGTVCPISFVQDVLFPYALRALPFLLEKQPQWPPLASTSSPLAPYILAFPSEFTTSAADFEKYVTQLSAANSKTPPLKALQGYLWKRGYDLGELVCPLFPDVVPALRRWVGHGAVKDDGEETANKSGHEKQIHIYSSGSIAAQKLLFAHTTAGDLTPLISAYYDPTTVGSKTEASSYVAIARAVEPATGTATLQQHLFLSDNPLEVRAALAAGMHARVVVREGNAPLGEADERELVLVRGFDEVGF